jgi:FixJ family two-component response regulator
LSHIKARHAVSVLSAPHNNAATARARAVNTKTTFSNPCTVVIVVDNDTAVRNSLKFSLEIEGFAVLAYRCAADLLDSSDPPDCGCLVVDQILPGMTGLDLIAKLRERRILTPAILITSHPSAAVIDRAKKAHIRIIEKPLLNHTLTEGIRAACLQPHPNPEND